MEADEVGDRQRFAEGIRSAPGRAGAPGTAAAITRIPNALAMRETAPPIAPVPTVTKVLPASSSRGLVKKAKSGERAQRPAFTAASCPATWC